VRPRRIASKEGKRGRTYPDKEIREGDSVLLRMVTRLAAIQGVLFSRQVQVLISNSTVSTLN
jgi:hypothetical protein